MNLGTVKFCVKLINVYGVKHNAHTYKVCLFHSSKNVNSTILPTARKTIKRKTLDVSDMFKRNKGPATGFFGYALVTIPICTFILGTWQVKRYIWKLDLLKYLNDRTSSEPRELPTDLHELESMEYCPVKVKGKYLHEREFTVCPKSLIVNGAGATEGKSGGIFSYGETNKGCYVITPFQLEDRNLTILVNRGWVRRQDSHPSKRKSGQIKDVVEITGLVRLNENRPPFVMRNDPTKNVWLYRDLNAMAQMHDTAPVFIDLIAKDSVPGGPIGGQTRISLRNEHLSYIITWYSLSAFTGVCWYKQFIRKMRLY